MTDATLLLPSAVLWDMDGTLVDTEPYWHDANARLAAEFGHDWTLADDHAVIGSGLWDAADYFRGIGVTLGLDAIVGRLADTVESRLRVDGVPFKPGVTALLGELHERGVRCALVTMSLSSMARRVAEALAMPVFEAIVAGDTVTRPKPHPEAYTTAAARLGVAAADCLAIEDSHTGLASARAAGAVVLGVPNAVALRPEEADAVWPSLAGRNADDLAAVFGAHTRARGGAR